LDWAVLAEAGKMRSVEIFLNFPIMDFNRNGKRSADISRISDNDRQRLSRFWGDETWHDAMFPPSETASLFPEMGELHDRGSNEGLVQAFRERLREKAGFKFVPEPVAMRNSIGATVYYLFWAGPNKTGNRIANAVLKRYRR
jgi:three-Cys-motif partner protein